MNKTLLRDRKRWRIKQIDELDEQKEKEIATSKTAELYSIFPHIIHEKKYLKATTYPLWNNENWTNKY